MILSTPFLFFFDFSISPHVGAFFLFEMRGGVSRRLGMAARMPHGDMRLKVSFDQLEATGSRRKAQEATGRHRKA